MHLKLIEGILASEQVVLPLARAVRRHLDTSPSGCKVVTERTAEIALRLTASVTSTDSHNRADRKTFVFLMTTRVATQLHPVMVSRFPELISENKAPHSRQFRGFRC
jgi:hypothetical protein